MKKDKLVYYTMKLFEEFRNGDSVRAIARKYSIPFETLRDRFKRYIGVDYNNYKGGEGTITAVLKEYLSDYSEATIIGHKLREWLEIRDNLDRLTKANYKIKKTKKYVYTQQKIIRDEYYQLKTKSDLRDSPFLTEEKMYPDRVR
jgi:hypothetical protein